MPGNKDSTMREIVNCSIGTTIKSNIVADFIPYAIQDLLANKEVKSARFGEIKNPALTESGVW
jgi:hypothetical protein